MGSYNVQSNGKAQAGLKAGDTVKTAGGTYKITGVKSDGSYSSSKVTTSPTTTSSSSSKSSSTKTPSYQSQISPYSTAFYDAQKNGDWQGMQTANDEANKIRNQYGDAAQYATDAINSVKNSSDRGNGLGGTSGIGYTNNPVAYNPQNDQLKALQEYQASQNDQIMKQLTSAYDASKINLDSQIPSIQQNANDLRNQNDTAYQTQYLPDLYAALEQSGGYKGGEVVNGTQGLLTTRGNNLNSINNNESNQLQQLQTALQTLEAQKGQAVAQAQQGVNSDVLTQQLSAIKSAQDQSNWQSNFDQQKLNDAYNQSVTDAGLTGYYKGNTTQAGQANLASLQAQKLQNDALELQNSYLPQQLKDQAKLLAQQVKNGTLDYTTGLAQIAQIKAQTANVGASTALGWANLANDKNQQAYNQGQDTIKNNQTAFNNAVNQIDSLYVSKDTVTGANTVNKSGLRSYILSLGLPDTQTTQLLSRYGV